MRVFEGAVGRQDVLNNQKGYALTRRPSLWRALVVLGFVMVSVAGCTALKKRFGYANKAPVEQAAATNTAKSKTSQFNGEAYRICTKCVLVTKDGRVVSSADDTVLGALEKIIIFNDKVQFIGWGTDVGSDMPAKSILIFAGDDLIYSAPPDQRRYDVARSLKQSGVVNSGFSVTLPKSLFNNDEAGRKRLMRIFALSNVGTAIELKYKKQ